MSDAVLLLALAVGLLLLWWLVRGLRGAGRDQTPTAIYALTERQSWLGKERVIYIGQSVDPQKRLQQHRKGTRARVDRYMQTHRVSMHVLYWVPRWQADEAERHEIEMRQPPLNVAGKRRA